MDLIRLNGLEVEVSTVYDQIYILTLCRRNTPPRTETSASNLHLLHFDDASTEEATVSKRISQLLSLGTAAFQPPSTCRSCLYILP
jgi:hypothetical protein